jgi:phosphoglycerate kinase
MKIRSIRDADVQGKRVLVRVDFNVPMEGGRITDDTRIRAALPTIQDLLNRGAAVILVSHLGRPKGTVVDNLRLAPIGKHLAELIGRPVQVADDVAGPDAQAKARTLKPGEILLLENVRFEPGEEKNDPELAKRLAALADLFVNDAFGTAHRAHASTVGVAAYLPAYAGYLMEAEIHALQRLLDNPDRPYVAILGGAKVSDKLGVLRNLLDRVDGMLIGGGMANTFLLAQGVSIGTSLVEPDLTGEASDILTRAHERGVAIALPVDVVVAPNLDSEGKVVPIDQIPADHAIYDIGPETISQYSRQIASARTIFWNGPMGVFERPQFAKGTLEIARAVADASAYTVVGGGDSIAALELAGVAGQISHISTGGGASLEFIEGRALPGIVALAQDEVSG